MASWWDWPGLPPPCCQSPTAPSARLPPGCLPHPPLHPEPRQPWARVRPVPDQPCGLGQDGLGLGLSPAHTAMLVGCLEEPVQHRAPRQQGAVPEPPRPVPDLSCQVLLEPCGPGGRGREGLHRDQDCSVQNPKLCFPGGTTGALAQARAVGHGGAELPPSCVALCCPRRRGHGSTLRLPELGQVGWAGVGGG